MANWNPRRKVGRSCPRSTARTASSSSTSATGRTVSTPTGSLASTPGWTRWKRPTGPGRWSVLPRASFYCNGLDLDWLSAHPDQHQDYVVSVQELFARVLSLPVITVAALQGHTFAAGAMFSLAQDFRVMRADRGFWCLPKADINIPFTPGMAALIQARLTPQTAHEAMLHRTPIWRDHGGSRQHRRPGGWPKTPCAPRPSSSRARRSTGPATPSAPSRPGCTPWCWPPCAIPPPRWADRAFGVIARESCCQA